MANELKVGDLLQNGKYRIDEVIGNGGFGITYKAMHVTLNKVVAIKECFVETFCQRDENSNMVTAATTKGKEYVSNFLRQFLKEARTIAAFDHNNIVNIHDVFEENGTAYYVMDFYTGSLNTLFKKGPMSERDALAYIMPIADALDYLHKAHVVHHDVKPGNIMLKNGTEPILIDFGLSRHFQQDGSMTSTVPIGVSKGYAPVEQYNNEDKSFSPTSDVYALSATLMALLMGKVPPEATKLISAENFPKRPANVSFATWNVIRCGMQIDKNKRIQSIQEWKHKFQEPPVDWDANRVFNDNTQLVDGGVQTGSASGFANTSSNPTTGSSPAASQPRVATGSSLSQPSKPAQNSGNKKLVIGIAVAFLIVIAAVLVFVLSDNKKSDDDVDVSEYQYIDDDEYWGNDQPSHKHGKSRIGDIESDDYCDDPFFAGEDSIMEYSDDY